MVDPGCCRTSFDNVDITSITDINLYTGCCLGTIMLTTADKEMPNIPIKLCNDKAVEIEQVIRNLRERDQRMLGNNARGATGGATR